VESSLEGERKVVTVLFADVANFTGISEKLDPEDVHDLMDGCFEILGEEIHRAGGSINQYTGDGVMALFGAPVFYEDHIQRACYAALHAQARMKGYTSRVKRRYQALFQLRIGIHTGKVVVGAIGIDLRRDYTAAGDTTNLAARLQALAPPAGIFVSSSVRDATRVLFRFRTAGTFAVKGKQAPVTVFGLLGERKTKGKAPHAMGGPPPFVNRKDELAVMQEVFNAALAGTSRMVAVVGEPGVGKSRLLAAFRETLQNSGVLALEGRCLPYGEATAFYPVIQMIQAYLGVSPEDRRNIGTVVATEKTKDPQLVSLLRSIFELFAQPDPDAHHPISFEGRKRAIFRALRSRLGDLLRTRPVALMFDDMQWVDATTREFLFFLLRAEPAGPLFTVCSGRMSHHPWCPDSPDRFLHLAPLSGDDSLRVFQSVLGTDRFDRRISDQIIEQAGGNPLFLVEMGETIRRRKLMVCDASACTLTQEIESLEIPETIRGVLTARLDALPGSAKRAIQLASVIGVEFSVKVLEHLWGHGGQLREALVFLETEGLLDRRSPAPDERLAFRHPMMQEIAYRGLLRRTRKENHRRVGEAMERLYRDDLSRHAGFLAYHFYRAEDWHKALAYTLDAGDRARRSFACQEALTSFDRALDILQKGEWDHAREKALQIHKWKGAMHYCVGQVDKSRTTFERMLAEARALGDGEAQAEAIFQLGWISFYAHHPRAAIAYMRRAIGQSQDLDLPETLLKAKGFLGFIYSVLGRLKEARGLLVEAVTLSRAANSLEGKAWGVSYLIQYHNWTGRFQEALTLCDELFQLNEMIQSPFFHIVLQFRKGLVYGALGRLEEAERVLTDGLAHLEIGDAAFWRPRFLNTLGWVYSEGGRIQKALDLNQQSLREALPTGDPETIFNATINVGENHLHLGDLGKAEAVLEQAWDKVKGTGIFYTRWRYRTRLLISLADLYGKMGKRERAMPLVNRAIQAARDKGARRHEARALQVKARILFPTRPPSARRCLEQALDLCVHMGTRLLKERIQEDLTATR